MQARRTAPTIGRAAAGWSRMGPTVASSRTASECGGTCARDRGGRSACCRTAWRPTGPARWPKWRRSCGEAARAASLEEAADRLRTDRVSLASALRWVRRRVLAVQALLTALCTLYPERFGGLEPRLETFSGALDSQAVLPCLRAIAEPRLGALPAPAGFFRPWNGAGLARPARLPHANGLDPPPAAA